MWNVFRKFSRCKCLRNKWGQSTVEYLLMVAFGAVFAVQVTRFLNDVFQEGLRELENTIEVETASGQGFGNGQ